MIYVYAIVAAALVSFGGYAGYRVMDGKVERAEQATKQASLRAHSYAEARDREIVKEKIVTKFVDRQVVLQGAIREIVKEVPVRLACETSPAGLAVLPGEFRLLHDKLAATASAAYAPARPPDAATPAAQSIAPGEVLDGVAANYANCAFNAVQLMALQDYVEQQLVNDKQKDKAK